MFQNAGYRSPILALLNRAPARSGSTTIIGLQHRFPSGRLRRALSRWWPIAYVPNLSGWVGGRSDVRRYRAIASKEARVRDEMRAAAGHSRRAVHSYQLVVERMTCSKSSKDIEVFAPRIRFASSPTTVRNGASGSVAANAMASATVWGSEGSPESRLVSASRSDSALASNADVSDQGNLSSAIIENRDWVGVLVGGW